MDILKQHFEKIIFGVILAGMLWYSFGLLQEISSLNEMETARFLPSEEEAQESIDVLDEEEFRVDHLLSGTGLTWRPEEDDIGGRGVFYPGAYIRCVAEDCSNWLPYDADACPWCDAEQGADRAEPGRRDADDDDIPDDVEEQYDFLDPQDPDDADEDYDEDWFTNLEEIEHGTDPGDKTSYPLLARNLQLRAIRQDRMDFVFKNIIGGRDNVPKEDWDLAFNVLRDGSWKTEFANVGDSIKGYEIKDVEVRTETVYSKQVNDDVEQNVSVVFLQKDDQEPVMVERNKRGVVGKKIRFRFFMSADDAEEYEDYTISANEELVLTGADGEEERYRAASVDADKNEVEVESVTRAEEDPVTVTDELPREYEGMRSRESSESERWDEDMPFEGDEFRGGPPEEDMNW